MFALTTRRVVSSWCGRATGESDVTTRRTCGPVVLGAVGAVAAGAGVVVLRLVLRPDVPGSAPPSRDDPVADPQVTSLHGELWRVVLVTAAGAAALGVALLWSESSCGRTPSPTTERGSPFRDARQD